MLFSERARSMKTMRVKCVICDHRFDAPLTNLAPECTRCMGPVTVVRVVSKPDKRASKGKLPQP
jgi:hypothetical protein